MLSTALSWFVASWCMTSYLTIYFTASWMFSLFFFFFLPFYTQTISDYKDNMINTDVARDFMEVILKLKIKSIVLVFYLLVSFLFIFLPHIHTRMC